MWPFEKKKSASASENNTDASITEEQAVGTDSAAGTQSLEGTTAADAVADASADGDTSTSNQPAESTEADNQVEAADKAVSAKAAAPAVSGPFDGAEHNIADFDFSDFSSAILDLGSLLVPLPKDSQVQVEMGPRGPKMLHILTEQGRITPVAFAAPVSGGQWEKALADIRESMENDGIQVTIEEGPWGAEIVGQATENGNVIRIIGVDGPRWMLRVTLATHNDKADAIAQLGRDVIARTIVQRGDAAILAGDSLPVRLPKPLADQVVAEMKRRNEMQQAAQEGSGTSNPAE